MDGCPSVPVFKYYQNSPKGISDISAKGYVPDETQYRRAVYNVSSQQVTKM